MLSVKYYLISPQQAYNILLYIALIAIHSTSLKCQCAPKKTLLKIQNLKLIMCISFNKAGRVQLIYHESRYT